ncbi:hypothetical protein SDJN03_14086, partial [Cucurbita argyrosperma subsp. sororia]
MAKLLQGRGVLGKGGVGRQSAGTRPTPIRTGLAAYKYNTDVETSIQFSLASPRPLTDPIFVYLVMRMQSRELEVADT